MTDAYWETVRGYVAKRDHIGMVSYLLGESYEDIERIAGQPIDDERLIDDD